MGNFKPHARGGFGGRPGGDGGNRFGGKSFGSKGRFGDRGGGGGGFGRGRDSGSFERGPVEMHDATCSQCGKRCQVPFRPTGSRPVFCSDCFRKDGEGEKNFGSRNNDKPAYAPRSVASGASGLSPDQFKQLNAKLDKILAVLQELELDIEEDLELDAGENADEDEDEDSEDDSKSE